MKRALWFLGLCVVPTVLSAQLDVEPHRASSERLIQAALRDSFAYKRLARLVDGFGHRMSGSESLERAIDWILDEMRRDGFENVHKEPVTIPRWVRGEESAELVSPRPMKLSMLGLGRSVGTPVGGITAPVLVVRSFAELRARAADARGRIVLFNVPFDSTIHPFTAYGRTVVYRGAGPDSAHAVGAVAALVRTVAPYSLRSPHTGGTAASDTVHKASRIPAAALSIEDAEMLQRMQDRGERIVLRLTMGARYMGEVRSHNVVAEIRGSEKPDEIIVMGGHIDSWDVGQGAMDDGGGCMAAWEALRLIKQLGVRPKRTIRVVLWTAEEIGLMGAVAYRDQHRGEVGNHVLAMESDNGVFRPRALNIGAGPGGLEMGRAIASLLRGVGVDSAQAGGPQADISPLYALGVPVATIDVDPWRYFWHHHSDSDTIDKLNPVDLSRNAAIFAVVANVAANMDGTLPRVR